MKKKKVDLEAKKTGEHLKRLLDTLPKSPGVYQFKDREGHTIYVGKAKVLRSRVQSYFRKTPKEPRPIEVMRAKIEDIEIITVRSELEALILETNLIKELRPRYNIVMRDDKNYVYVKITTQQDFPEVFTVRRMEKDGSTYFGPYTSSERIHKLLKVLQKIFPYRSCRGSIAEVYSPEAGTTALPMNAKPTPVGKEELRTGKVLVRIKGLNRAAPCLDYHIKRCSGPCIGAISKDDYGFLITEVQRFLSGKTEDLGALIQQRMTRASEDRQFEEAARWRDQLKTLAELEEKQHIISTKQEDQDIIGIAHGGGMGCVNLFRVRSGKLIGRETFPLRVDERIAQDPDVIEQFLSQYYSEAADIPPEILVPEESTEYPLIENLISELASRRVRIVVPHRGDKKRLIELATNNAKRGLDELKVRWMSDEARTKGAMAELQAALGLGTLRRIECYDISHIQGTGTVGSMVVFLDGLPFKAHYRRFKVKTLPEGQTDDFASMMEVLERRLKYIQEALLSPESEGIEGESVKPRADDTSFTDIPDLIILDGGKGQLSSVVQVMKTLGIDTKLRVVALAKQEEELFLSGESAPLILPRDSHGLFLVQRIRDEAHRFALSYHQHIRSKKMVKSALDTISGVGPVAKKMLLSRFGSVRGIKKASIEELTSVVGERTAHALKEAL